MPMTIYKFASVRTRIGSAVARSKLPEPKRDPATHHFLIANL
ncbi:hypothetical protein M2267_005660 [Ensifer sp. KUDG1]